MRGIKPSVRKYSLQGWARRRITVSHDLPGCPLHWPILGITVYLNWIGVVSRPEWSVLAVLDRARHNVALSLQNYVEDEGNQQIMT